MLKKDGLCKNECGYYSICAVVLCLILSGCAKGGYRGERKLPERVAILSEAEAARAVSPCSREAAKGVSGNWKPATTDILLAESELANYVNARLSKSFDDYYRQYSGILINGKRVLLIHAVYGPKFMSSFRAFEQEIPDWRTTYIWVCDGHDNSWGVEFYLDEKRFANFETNQGL